MEINKKKRRDGCMNPLCMYNRPFLKLHLSKSPQCLYYYQMMYLYNAKQKQKDSIMTNVVHNNIVFDNTVLPTVNDSETCNLLTSYSITNKKLTIPQFTTSHFCETKLLHILNNANVPHDLFNLVLNWGKDAHLLGYKFDPMRLHQKTQIEYLERYESLNIIKPYQISIKLDFNPSIIVPVSVYDFIFFSV